MTKIITTEETDIELDPESLTDNIDVGKTIFENKSKMFEAIRDLDNLIDSTIGSQQASTTPVEETTNRNLCFIRIKSKNTNNEFSMNFKLVGLNQGVIERNCSEVEIEAPENKLIRFFSFYQNNISLKKHSKKSKLNQLKVLFAKNKNSLHRRKKRVIHKNDVYVVNLNINMNGKKIKLIDSNEALWRISEMRYTFENNRSTCRVSLTRTH